MLLGRAGSMHRIVDVASKRLPCGRSRIQNGGCTGLSSKIIPSTTNIAVARVPLDPLGRGRGLSSLARERIGFVGLGNMGSCMATSLTKAGHDMVLFDVDRSKATALAAAIGAAAASSLQELAETSSSVITMLPNTRSVEAVYLGNPTLSGSDSVTEKTTSSTTGVAAEGGGLDEPGAREEGGGLLDWVKQGTLVVDSSTIDPLASKKMNAIATRKGVTMVDAPVSGGVPAAANATLTFIVGGTEEGVEHARPLLMSMGTKVVHCGEPGAGCVAKVCNNLCLAVTMVGVSEAMSLGVNLGMDPKVLASVLNASTARSWSTEVYNPYPGVMESVPSSRGFQGGFAASLMEKDLHLALQAARESSQSLPMGALAHQLYSLMCGHGNAKKDFSGIYELISAGSGRIRSEGGRGAHGT